MAGRRGHDPGAPDDTGAVAHERNPLMAARWLNAALGSGPEVSPEESAAFVAVCREAS